MTLFHGIRIVEIAGNGSSTIGIGDVTPPVIVSAAVGSVVSLHDYRVDLAASEPVIFSIRDGADGALFTLDGATLRLAAKNLDDGKAVFVAHLRATDLAGNATDFDHTVTVTPAAGVLDFSDPLNSGLQ